LIKQETGLTQATSLEKFAEWAIFDVLGHQRYVGRVTEHTIAGQGFVRVDMPATEKTLKWTKLIGTASIYAITPIEESIARAMCEELKQAPISAWDLKLLRLPAIENPQRTSDKEFYDLVDRLTDDDEESSL
jgi:hypothetical protein